MKMQHEDIMSHDQALKLNNDDVMKMQHSDFMKMATEEALKQAKNNGLVVDSGNSSTYSSSPLSEEQYADRVTDRAVGEVEAPAANM